MSPAIRRTTARSGAPRKTPANAPTSMNGPNGTICLRVITLPMMSAIPTIAPRKNRRTDHWRTDPSRASRARARAVRTAGRRRTRLRAETRTRARRRRRTRSPPQHRPPQRPPLPRHHGRAEQREPDAPYDGQMITDGRNRVRASMYPSTARRPPAATTPAGRPTFRASSPASPPDTAARPPHQYAARRPASAAYGTFVSPSSSTGLGDAPQQQGREHVRRDAAEDHADPGGEQRVVCWHDPGA